MEYTKYIWNHTRARPCDIPIFTGTKYFDKNHSGIWTDRIIHIYSIEIRNADKDYVCRYY